jgi:hypothetical protein
MSKLAENLQEKISKSGLSQRKITKMAGIFLLAFKFSDGR